jgi:hypothetical protein
MGGFHRRTDLVLWRRLKDEKTVERYRHIGRRLVRPYSRRDLSVDMRLVCTSMDPAAADRSTSRIDIGGRPV